MTTGGASAHTPRPKATDTVEAIAEAVLDVPGVVALSAGPFGEVGTYLLGRKLAGVRTLQGRWEIAVVARFGSNLNVLARHIQRRVAPLADGPVDVRVVDIAEVGPDGTSPTESGPIETGPIESGPIESGPIETGTPGERL